MYKLGIDFNEGTQDYATCYWYKGLDNKPFYKVEISKPWDYTDYNNEWKQGLYTFMHTQIMEKFGNVIVVDI